MKAAIAKYLEYLQSVKNSSPHTILNYRRDLEQFLAYLSPPGLPPPALKGVAHAMIREFVAHLHDHGLAKSSIARKLAALRSFFKYCVREGHLKENPARLVPTPKLPKRIPSVLSAEEMNGFLNHLGGTGQAASGGRESSTKSALLPPASAVKPQGKQSRSVQSKKASSYAATGRSWNFFTPQACASANSPASILPIWTKRNAFSASAARAVRNASFLTGLRLRKLWKNTGRCANCSWSQGTGRVAGTGRTPKRSSSIIRAGGLRSAPSGASSKNTCASPTSTGTCIRIRCVTPSPRTSSRTAPTSAPFRNFSATSHSRPRRNIPMPPSAN